MIQSGENIGESLDHSIISTFLWRLSQTSRSKFSIKLQLKLSLTFKYYLSQFVVFIED